MRNRVTWQNKLIQYYFWRKVFVYEPIFILAARFSTFGKQNDYDIQDVKSC